MSIAKLHSAKWMISEMQIFTSFQSSLFTRKNLKILSFLFACTLAFPCINLVMHKESMTANLYKTNMKIKREESRKRQ